MFLIVESFTKVASYLQSAATTQKKDTAVTNSAHNQSSRIANQRDDVRNKNHDSVCKSWWASNSDTNFSSTQNARIVCKPCNVALKWENTGLRAVEDNIYIWQG